MSAKKSCLRCSQDMSRHWSHIGPRCGKFFAFYTPAQTATLLVVGVVVATLVNVALVAALWYWA
jgi:hypothetical protein